MSIQPFGERPNGKAGNGAPRGQTVVWELEECLIDIDSLIRELENLDDLYTHRFRRPPHTERDSQQEMNMRTEINEQRKKLFEKKRHMHAFIARAREINTEVPAHLEVRISNLESRIADLDGYLAAKFSE